MGKGGMERAVWMNGLRVKRDIEEVKDENNDE